VRRAPLDGLRPSRKEDIWATADGAV